MLRTRLVFGFLFVLSILAAALAVLHSFAIKGHLYRSAFVYRLSVGSLKAQISPFSVIATLVAVSLALCWDMIDRHMRVLQPYLHMAKEPTITRRGACLSYQSSYWLWAAGKAAMNRHWLLSLITAGTTLFQICECTIHIARQTSSVLECVTCISSTSTVSWK